MAKSPGGESSAPVLAGVASLLEQFRLSGKPEDFAQIVARYGAIVFNECRRVTRDIHDAEDAAQLTFLAFAIELKSGTEIRKPVPWLQRVSRRQALKIVRSRGRRKRREDAVRRNLEVTTAELNGVHDEQALTAALVRDAIDALPERYRLPLVLHYFGGLSMDLIAAELGITRTAVGTRLHRARKMVADQLSARGLAFDAGTLTRALASLVPLAVVSNLVASASVGPATSSAGLASSTALMLQASMQFISPKGLAVTAICLSVAGSAMGWRELPRVIEQIRTRLDLRPLLDRFLAPELPLPSFGTLTPPPVVSDSSGMLALDPPSYAPTDDPYLPVDVSLLSQRRPVELISSSPKSTSLVVSQAPVRQWQAPKSPEPFFTPSRSEWKPPRVAAAPVPPMKTNVLAAPAPRPVVRAAATASAGGRGEPGVSSPKSLIVGGAKHADEHFIQTAGEVRVDRLIVGDAGRGIYSLHGRRLEVGELVLGKRRHSRGELDIGNGEVVVKNPEAPIEVGSQGKGVVLIGNQDAPGSFSTADGSKAQLIVRSSYDARGVIRGWGHVNSNGIMVNNGLIIADGFDRLRSLNFDSFKRVTNTIDNTYDGSNGWYALRGGRVKLPIIRVQAGDGTYTWGESPDDPTIDLVNSVRFTVQGQPKPAAVSVSLRTVAVADALDISLPNDASIFGLWDFSSTTLSPQSMSFAVRYNADAANSFGYGEIALQLLAYTEEGWQRANNGWLSVTERLIGGEFDGRVSFLAVAMDLNSDPSNWLPSLYTTNTRTQITAIETQVPEPLLLPLIGGAMLLCRRRRSIPHS